MTGTDDATLVTGASGFLGGLVAAALLADGRRPLVLPVRPKPAQKSAPEACRARLRAALTDRGLPSEEADERMRRVEVIEAPPAERLAELDAIAASSRVREIVHCAGCVDYFDVAGLQAANVELTAAWLERARRWRVGRFVYLSTAYGSGYRTDLIRESLHPDPPPAAEPTDYTRSKRAAERRIADSGIPFLIIRPSVVIGDSRTGAYTGKSYGLYQMWRAIEGLLCREYYPIWYTVAPPAHVSFVHQDAFEAAFVQIHRSTPPDSFVHLVSDHDRSPTMRELCALWADVYAPAEIHCYATIDDVPLRSIPTRQRRFLELAAKNLEISTQPWRFETRHMDRLRAAGLHFADATLESIARCQRRYVEGSPRIQEHVMRHAGRRDGPTRFVDWPAASQNFARGS
jgi:nucleoside-diphosphate-sugar epimerase